MAKKESKLSKELTQLHKDLLTSSENLRLYKKAESHKIFIAKRLDEENAREQALRKKLKKEKRDFDKMKGGTIKYIFHSILQNVKSQREKEKQEWLAAQLQWEQCCNELATLKEEYQDVGQVLNDLSNAPAVYEKLFNIKEKTIASLSSSQEVLGLSDKLLAKNEQKKEIGEAIEAGGRLIQQLRYALDYLKSASGWGTWDLLGGGIIATAVKRGRMDQARDCIQNAQHLLNQYNKELADVKSSSLELPAGGF
ncbi:MAG: hypothetical protein AAB221_12770, partial [Bacteroidota bacterium]